jgi:hypothetical protein
MGQFLLTSESVQPRRWPCHSQPPAIRCRRPRSRSRIHTVKGGSPAGKPSTTPQPGDRGRECASKLSGTSRRTVSRRPLPIHIAGLCDVVVAPATCI